jgi:four helix bundle protein
MATYNCFKDLPIWQEARKISLEIYSITYELPFSKDFALTGQIRRAVGSIMDNIAEGYERDSRLEFINFLSIAKGSAGEVRSQLHRAFDLKYTTEEHYEILINKLKDLSAQIANFIRYLNKTSIKGAKFKERTM